MTKRYSIFILSFLLCAVFFFGTEVFHRSDCEAFSVNFLDVGQGDAILVQEGDFQLLIDGGPDERVLQEMSRIISPFDRKIELIVLTHPHADHLVGLNKVLDRYEIGEIISNGVVSSSASYLEFLTKIKQKNITFNVPKKGDEKPVRNGNIKFLWPGDKFANQTVENVNNTSVISKVCYLGKCVLLLGDQENDEQKLMVDYYKDAGNILSAQIIKAAHHGSNNGLLPELYDISKPEYAVISVGKDNPFGHPHQAVLDFLNNKKISLFRTDQMGTIRFFLKENNIEVKSF